MCSARLLWENHALSHHHHTLTAAATPKFVCVVSTPKFHVSPPWWTKGQNCLVFAVEKAKKSNGFAKWCLNWQKVKLSDAHSVSLLSWHPFSNMIIWLKLNCYWRNRESIFLHTLLDNKKGLQKKDKEGGASWGKAAHTSTLSLLLRLLLRLLHTSRTFSSGGCCCCYLRHEEEGVWSGQVASILRWWKWHFTRKAIVVIYRHPF